MQKILPILGICLVSLGSCKNNTDCSATIQQLQDQLNSKDSRIQSLEDSLHMMGGNTGSTSAADTSNSTATNDAGEKEASYYRENHIRKHDHNIKYPGEFPEGSERLLTKNDIDYLSEWGLKMIRAEIYARHGGTFNDKRLQSHFNHQSWYHAKGSNVNSSLSSIEKQNIEFLNNYKYPYHS